MTYLLKNLKLTQILALLLLLLISCSIIFYKFNVIPNNLSFDEVEFTKLALSLDNKPYTPYSTYATGHSTLYFYVLLFSFKIFGVNNFALRFPSGLFGVINVILFYLIIKFVFQQFSNSTIKQFSKYLPFILSLIFITSRWYINFSRFAFEITFLLSLELLAVYFFFKHWKNHKTHNILLSAFFTGLAYNSYTPGRIFFVLIFGFLLFKKFKTDSGVVLRRNIGVLPRMTSFWQSASWRSVQNLVRVFDLNIAFSIIIFLFTIAPLSLYLTFNKDIRFDQQFFLKNTEMSIGEKAQFLGENISKITLMFNFAGDLNGRHNYPGKPALNIIFSIFVLGGLYLALKNFKRFPNNFFVCYFLLGIIPAILTYPWENPNMLRTFTILPSMVYFVGKSLEYFIIVNQRHPGLSRIPIKISYILFFFLFLSSLYELRTYFKYQALVFPKAFEIKKSIDQIDFTKPIIFKELEK